MSELNIQMIFLICSQRFCQVHIQEINFQNSIFQQNNALPHTPRVILTYFQNFDINLLPFPATSPNLSTTKYMWDHKRRKLLPYILGELQSQVMRFFMMNLTPSLVQVNKYLDQPACSIDYLLV